VKIRRVGFGAEGRSCWSLDGARRIGKVASGPHAGPHPVVDDTTEADGPHPGPLPEGKGERVEESAELELVGSERLYDEKKVSRKAQRRKE